MTTRRDRILLSAIVFGVLLAQVLLYPGIDTLVVAFGSTTEINASMWFLAAEFIAFIVFAGVWGAASDSAGKRRPFIVLGAVGGAIGYAILGLIPQFTSLPFIAVIGFRVIQGAATIGALSLAMTMLMDLPGGHGRNMGAAGIAIGLGMSLGSPLGGQFYEIGPFIPLYFASVILLGVGVLAHSIQDRAPAPDRTTMLDVLKGLRDQPDLVVPFAYGFIDRFTAGFFALVGTLYFRNSFELSPGATGLMLALFFVPFALLQYPFGIISDRVGRTGPVVVGSAVYGIGVWGVGIAPTVETAGVMMIVVGLLGALMAPATMALVTDIARETRRGVAMAGFNVFGSLGFLAGVLIGGSIASAMGYLAAFLVAGGLELLIALTTFPFFLRFGRSRTGGFP
ncbi:MFS transporter [Halodesulfurarchaeum sp.]|uniref:MFS transporter n=1 Tax=Halodesulfurarchaeum sp. TaxID=1980530 RepID=UPI002FC3BE91